MIKDMQEELKKREAMKTAPYVRDGVKENWFLESIKFENFISTFKYSRVRKS